MKKYLPYFKQKLQDEFNHFKLYKNKTGVGFAEYCRLKFQNDNRKTSLFNKNIQVPDAFWHLHSLNEIFIEETYKFKTKTPRPLIIDCGSNVGLSIIYFKMNHPTARIIGFEPDPAIFKMLQNNLGQFDFSYLELVNKAVWISEGELIFNSFGALSGAINFKQKSSKESKTVVATVRLKDYLKEGQKVDFLKMDIEGAEFEIVNDCLEELKNVDKIFIEYHRLNGDQNLLGEFIGKLEKAGFRIYIKEAWNNLPHPYCNQDYNPMYDLQLNIFGYR